MSVELEDVVNAFIAMRIMSYFLDLSFISCFPSRIFASSVVHDLPYGFGYLRIPAISYTALFPQVINPGGLP